MLVDSIEIYYSAISLNPQNFDVYRSPDPAGMSLILNVIVAVRAQGRSIEPRGVG
ncbi:hypothetical protein [Chamaesiphon sp. VAR_48_metabat_403]|uniref:hypothetical protein n=1 Tax=Chamaesiphon sp. VAR_48_metabat_403 TaxID=2964700 RepID=UPI00286E6FC1|nr:hypothetical protein [Chamaesiphon sp. VAR_48_metabat_403]